MKILIPSYEPDERLLELIKKLKACCSYEIVLVDDGSGSKYADIFSNAKDLGCVVLTHAINKGKGCALKSGFSYIQSSGEKDGIVCADSDGQHQASDIIRIANAISEHPSKIILGCRYFSGEIPFRSRFGNEITAMLYTISTGVRLPDTQTGLRGYSPDMLDWLCSIPGERFEYEMNMLFKAPKDGYTFYEVVIKTVYLNNNSSSHFRAIRDSLRVYLPLLRFSASSIASAVLDISLLLFIQYVSKNLLLAAILARVCSSIFNYSVNKVFVFNQSNNSSYNKSFSKYMLLAAAVLAMNYSVLHTLNISLGIPLLISKLLTEAILFLFSYWSQCKFIFSNGTKHNTSI